VRLLALLPPYKFGDSMGLLLRNRLEQRRYRAQHQSQALLGRQTPARDLGERRLRQRVGRGSRRRLCETVGRRATSFFSVGPGAARDRRVGGFVAVGDDADERIVHAVAVRPLV